MKPKIAVSLEDVFYKYANDEEFKQAERLIKPYYELLVAIIRRRKDLGMTQKELAKKASTFQSRISKIESAEHDIRLSTLVQIAEALDTEVSIQLVPIEKPIQIEIGEGEYSIKVIDTKVGGQAQNFLPSEAGEFRELVHD